MCRRSSAEAVQNAGPRCLTDDTSSDSPHCQQTPKNGSHGDNSSSNDIEEVAWDFQLSLVSHANARSCSLPALSVSLLHWCAGDGSAASSNIFGISVEARTVSLKLQSSSPKPQHMECAVSGPLYT
jgi:hypothetical protein